MNTGTKSNSCVQIQLNMRPYRSLDYQAPGCCFYILVFRALRGNEMRNLRVRPAYIGTLHKFV
jgi:hypothetical protein